MDDDQRPRTAVAARAASVGHVDLAQAGERPIASITDAMVIRALRRYQEFTGPLGPAEIRSMLRAALSFD